MLLKARSRTEDASRVVESTSGAPGSRIGIHEQLYWDNMAYMPQLGLMSGAKQEAHEGATIARPFAPTALPPLGEPVDLLS